MKDPRALVSTVTLGKRPPPGDDPLTLLTECHGRLRAHAALALKLGQAEDPAALVEAAARLHRYFTVALPLHLADEEESLRPMLPPEPALDAALDRMAREHEEHERELRTLVPEWARVAATEAPALDEGRRLADAAGPLAAALEAHLQHEEQAIFPTLATFTLDHRARLVAAFRARRAQP